MQIGLKLKWAQIQVSISDDIEFINGGDLHSTRLCSICGEPSLLLLQLLASAFVPMNQFRRFANFVMAWMFS